MTTKTTTKPAPKKQAPKKVPRAVAENAAKENILHLRLERADHDALEALVLSTGLDRGALARLVIRAGLRVAENDPRDLLAPKVGATRRREGTGNSRPGAAVADGNIHVSPIRAAGHVEDEG